MPKDLPVLCVENADSSLPFSGVQVVIAIAMFDILNMVGFFLLSYFQAEAVDIIPARIWRVTDAIFCVSLLYMMLATGSYGVSKLSNPLSQISHILVNGSVIAGMEWLALWSLGFADSFEWPMNGPINLIGLGATMMCVTRLIIHQLLEVAAKRGAIAYVIAIVGAGASGKRLISALMQRREPWTQIIGFFDDRKNRLDDPVEGLEIKGTVGDLIEFARRHRVDEILVALPWSAEQRLLDILDQLKVIPANVRLAPDEIGHHFLDAGFSRIDGVPVYNIFRKPISGWGALLKRLEDLILGSIILVMVSPIMLLCALAIKLDSPGPILFKQNRYGYNNKLIGVYKFRSMYHARRDENCEQQTTKRDPRVTRVGNFIRRTSIDELPQLFNVLIGNMSLVGPRPHATNTKAAGKLFEEAVREYAARHKVKPGITGWAQVMGWRGETDTEEKIQRRVECDLYYMEHWSLFLDIEILFRTVMAVTGKNAY